MAKTITAVVAKYGLLGGDKLYQKRARLTLPYLVRQAKAGQTIYYSDLAKELNSKTKKFQLYIGRYWQCFNRIRQAHRKG